MASNLDLQNAVADFLTAQLAPYQPNVPPSFSNPASTAGVIVSTVVGPGHPLQYHVTTTLEQGGAQVGCWFGKVSKPMPYIHSNLYAVPAKQSSGSVPNIYQETGRNKKQFCVEVWAYTDEARAPLTALVNAFMGDAIRFSMPDGTIALLKKTNEINHDQEQVDSIWISQLFYEADITDTILISSGTTDVGEGYIVTDVTTEVSVTDDQGNILGSVTEDTTASGTVTP